MKATQSYDARYEGFYLVTTKDEESVAERLTNFVARVETDIELHDGDEVTREFAMAVFFKDGGWIRFRIPAAEFESLSWITKCVGPTAVVFPVPRGREHVKVAIQLTSTPVPKVQVRTHTGWAQINGEWLYLHAGGGIGVNGQRSDVRVELPGSLKGYSLPAPPEGEALAEAVRASWRVFDLAPLRITLPLLAGVYAAPLLQNDFAVHLVGDTGNFKSELASLAQRHYGVAFDSRNLPGSWLSTGNALEVHAHHAKDALFTVDDFVPGPATDELGERLLRAQGNRAGRSRMSSTRTTSEGKAPRGLIFSTGEDVPRGQSLRARTFILSVTPGDVLVEKLTLSQADASSGLLAAALAGYLWWLAPQLELYRLRTAAQLERLRSNVTTAVTHRRTADIVARLGFALETLIKFSIQVKAIDEGQVESFWKRGWEALLEAAKKQAAFQFVERPALRFTRLLRSALTKGSAHLVDVNGGEPLSAERWGWGSAGTDSVLRPSGDRIGWTDGENRYLDADAAYAVVRALGRKTGDTLDLTVDTLKTRLAEAETLASVAEDGEPEVRRMVEGVERAVLHLRADVLG